MWTGTVKSSLYPCYSLVVSWAFGGSESLRYSLLNLHSNRWDRTEIASLFLYNFPDSTTDLPVVCQPFSRREEYRKKTVEGIHSSLKFHLTRLRPSGSQECTAETWVPEHLLRNAGCTALHQQSVIFAPGVSENVAKLMWYIHKQFIYTFLPRTGLSAEAVKHEDRLSSNG